MAVKWNSSVKLIVFTLQHSTSSQIGYWAGWFAFICFNGLFFQCFSFDFISFDHMERRILSKFCISKRKCHLHFKISLKNHSNCTHIISKEIKRSVVFQKFCQFCPAEKLHRIYDSFHQGDKLFMWKNPCVYQTQNFIVFLGLILVIQLKSHIKSYFKG